MSLITTEVIHGHLNDVLDERVQAERQKKSNQVYNQVVDAARTLIVEIKVRQGAEAFVELDTLWRAFLNVFYEKNQALYNEVRREESERIINELAQASSVDDVLRLASMRTVVSNITDFASSIDMLLMSSESLKYLVDGYAIEVSPEERQFLEDVIQLFESGDFRPQNHFVVMQQIGERRMVIGGRVEEGELVRLGYDSLTHVCRTGVFDRVNSRQDITNIGDLAIHHVDENFEDYPAALTNPYDLPEGLFLVKCGTDWASVSLMGSRFSRALERN